MNLKIRDFIVYLCKNKGFFAKIKVFILYLYIIRYRFEFSLNLEYTKLKNSNINFGNYKNCTSGQLWWHTPLILALEKQRWPDLCEFKVIPAYVVSSMSVRETQTLSQ